MPNSQHSYTGRFVAIASLVIGLVGAVAPAVGNLDLSSSAGVVAGLVAISAVAVKYLDGWQRYEERLDGLGATASPAASEPRPALQPSATAEPAPEEAEEQEEPDAPVPGERLRLVATEDDEEPADIPFPPADDEIEGELEPPAAGEPHA